MIFNILLNLSHYEIIAICCVSVLFLFFVIITIFLVVDYFQRKKFKEAITHNFNTNIGYCIDFSKQIVFPLNLKDLRKKTKISYVDFLNCFYQDEQNLIKTWFQELVEGIILDDVQINLIRLYDMFLDKGNGKKELRKCLFICKLVDKKKKMLFLDSVFLFNIPNCIELKKYNRDAFYPLSVIKKKYEDGAFKKGSFIIFQIAKKNITGCPFSEQYVLYTVLDAIYKVANFQHTFIFMTEDKNEICILSDEMFTNESLSRFIPRIIDSIYCVFEIKGFLNYFDYYIVGSLVSELDEDYDQSYAILTKYFTLDVDEKKKYKIYNAETDKNINFEQSYKSEVTRLIRIQGVESYFRPVIHIANKRVVVTGYMSFLKLDKSIFKDMEEFKKYAKLYEMEKDYFSLCIRKILPRFISEKENSLQKLILEINIDQITSAIRSLPHFNGINGIDLILLFNTIELIDLENDEDFIRGIKNLKEKGYAIGLKIEGPNYVLKKTTYSLFDYFFADPLFNGLVKGNSSQFIKMHQTLDYLVKFNVPIIGINLDSMQNVELLVKAGLEYFSADCISPKSQMLLPIDKKISKKLLNMNK